MTERQPLLAVHNIHKHFGAVQALNGVSVHVDAGEVVALAGDNGAGKSVLIKTISGVHRQDEGTIIFDGKTVNFADAGAGPRRGYRDDLPGPLACRQFVDRRQYLPRPRAEDARPSASCRSSTAARMAKAAQGDDGAPRLPCRPAGGAGRRLLRRPAAGGRHRPRHLLERQAADHGRADGGARRSRAAQGPLPRPLAQGTGQGCHLHLAQPPGHSSRSPTGSSCCAAASRRASGSPTRRRATRSSG